MTFSYPNITALEKSYLSIFFPIKAPQTAYLQHSWEKHSLLLSKIQNLPVTLVTFAPTSWGPQWYAVKWKKTRAKSISPLCVYFQHPDMSAAKSVDGENLLNDVVVYLFFFWNWSETVMNFSICFTLCRMFCK